MFIFIIAILFIITLTLAFTLELLVVITAKETTTATIVDVIERKHIMDNRKFVSYAPVFEYYVDDKKYTKESLSGKSENIFQIGQQVQINYRKKNPIDAYLQEDKDEKKRINIMLIICVVGPILLAIILFN